jgi:hypothetical protein
VTAPADVTVASAYVERVKRYRHRAECLIPGCGWAGKVRDSLADAHTERRMHLNDHVISEITAAREAGG